MKSLTGRVGILVMSLLVAWPALGAVPVRGTSRNGENSSATFWNMMGPSQLLTLVKGTSKVLFKQQVICPTQDLANASDPTNTQNAGACESGSYLYIFQLRSTATNVTVQFSGLVGFTPDANSPNYGVMLCDDTNTLEMCTTAAENQLPDITFSAAPGNGTVKFVIPSFPNFPTGKNHQGQGLTLFILCQQSTPRPVSLPRIVLN